MNQGAVESGHFERAFRDHLDTPHSGLGTGKLYVVAAAAGALRFERMRHELSATLQALHSDTLAFHSQHLHDQSTTELITAWQKAFTEKHYQ